MSDPPLGRRRFAAAVAALTAGLAGCGDDDTENSDDSGDDADGENPDDSAINLSDSGSTDGERTERRDDGRGDEANGEN